jgi:hypothetical protein
MNVECRWVEKNSEGRRANNSFKINLLKAHSGSLC